MGSKHRSAAELAAEAEQRAEALRAKAHRQALAEQPEVFAIDRAIQTEGASGIKFERWKREAPDKIQSFQNRVIQWEQRQSEADIWLAESKEKIAALRKHKAALIDSLLED